MSPPDDIDLAVLRHTPGAAALLPFQDTQCLIMTNEDLMQFLSHRCAPATHAMKSNASVGSSLGGVGVPNQKNIRIKPCLFDQIGPGDPTMAHANMYLSQTG